MAAGRVTAVYEIVRESGEMFHGVTDVTEDEAGRRSLEGVPVGPVDVVRLTFPDGRREVWQGDVVGVMAPSTRGWMYHRRVV